MLIEDPRWNELVSALDDALRRIDVLEARAVLDPDDAVWLAGEVAHGPRLSPAFIARHELGGVGNNGQPNTVGSSDQPPTTVMGFLRAMARQAVQYPRCFIACGPNDPGKVALLETRVDDNGVITTTTTFFADAPQHLMKELTVFGDGVSSDYTRRELIAAGWTEVHRFSAECVPGTGPDDSEADAPTGPGPTPIAGTTGLSELPEREVAASSEEKPPVAAGGELDWS